MSTWRSVPGGILGCLLAASPSAATGVDRPPDKTTAAVDAIFSDLSKPGSPGCSLAVARKGKIIYQRGYGLANIEENVAITPQTVFDIGSTSKQFTAASILLLEKQGKLSVNDDVRKYIPELPDYGKKITILHLLNHTSGLRDYLSLMDLAGIHTDSVTTDEDALQIIARQRALNFDPGSEWLYSNTGYFLLSVIVKRVSGKTLLEFAAENIFTPLAMTHTQYRDDHTSLLPGRALAYEAKEKDKGDGFHLSVSYFEQTGDGAVHTSVEDLLKWDENFYTGQVGGKDLLAELQEQGKLNSRKVLDYAKGLSIGNYRGLRTVSHGGAWGGYRAQLLRFPEQHFSVVCLCNLANANPSKRAGQVADIYLNSLMKPKEDKKESEEREEKKENEVTVEQLKAYMGDYWSDELGVAYRLGLVNGKLKIVAIVDAAGFVHAGHLLPNAFGAVAADEFEMKGKPITLHFQRDSNQNVKGFTLDAGRTKGMIFSRREGGGK